MLRLIFSMAFSIVLTLSAPPSTPSPAQPTGTVYFVGMPTKIDPETIPSVMGTLTDLFLNAEPGDTVEVFDAARQRRICRRTIPETRTAKGRLNIVADDLVVVRRHFEAGLDGPGHLNLIDVPNFIDLVADAVREGKAETRILLVGLMYHGNGTDTRFHFRPGAYPTDGHILLPRDRGDFGTVGARRLFKARIDVCDLDWIDDDLDRRAIQRFWSIYAAERGITLTTWQADPGRAAELLLADRAEPYMAAEINRFDRRVEIRRVVSPTAVSHTFTLIVVIDASGSMEHAFDALRRETPLLAERVFEAGAEVRIAFLPFRETPLDPLPPTPVRSTLNDGGQSVQAVHAYLGQIQPQNALVDPGAALRQAIEIAASDTLPSDRTAIVLVGDTGFEEVINGDLKQRTILDALNTWRAGGPGRSVHSVFVGGSDGERSQFFRRVAEISGHGMATDFQTVSDRIAEETAGLTHRAD